MEETTRQLRNGTVLIKDIPQLPGFLVCPGPLPWPRGVCGGVPGPRVSPPGQGHSPAAWVPRVPWPSAMAPGVVWGVPGPRVSPPQIPLAQINHLFLDSWWFNMGQWNCSPLVQLAIQGLDIIYIILYSNSIHSSRQEELTTMIYTYIYIYIYPYPFGSRAAVVLQSHAFMSLIDVRLHCPWCRWGCWLSSFEGQVWMEWLHVDSNLWNLESLPRELREWPVPRTMGLSVEYF